MTFTIAPKLDGSWSPIWCPIIVGDLLRGDPLLFQHNGKKIILIHGLKQKLYLVSCRGVSQLGGLVSLESLTNTNTVHNISRATILMCKLTCPTCLSGFFKIQCYLNLGTCPKAYELLRNLFPHSDDTVFIHKLLFPIEDKFNHDF